MTAGEIVHALEPSLARTLSGRAEAA